MIEVNFGETALLGLVLTDGATGKFPQAEIFDSGGVAIGGSPVSLSPTANGLYQGTVAAPAVGEYSVIYLVYNDAGHTILALNYERVSEHLKVIDPVEETIWGELLPAAFGAGTAGEIMGTNIDATISTRATPLDILSDLIPFPGADIDASISSRSSHNPADVDVLLSAIHGAGNWEGDTITSQQVRDAMKLAPTAGAPAAGSVDTHLDTIEADTAAIEPLVSTNLDATISSRGTADPGDNMGLTAAGTAAVDVELSATHGAGSWESDSDTDWTAGEKEEIRGALGVTGVQSVPGGGGQLQDVLTDTSTIEPLAVANLDAPISTRAIPGDAMAITAGAVDDIWNEAITAHIAPGTAGQALTMALGNAGGQVRDDALTWDANDRPLTLRRRIFPDAITANASTPGGTGEGELLTVTIGASHIDAARWQSLLRTV